MKYISGILLPGNYSSSLVFQSVSAQNVYPKIYSDSSDQLHIDSGVGQGKQIIFDGTGVSFMASSNGQRFQSTKVLLYGYGQTDYIFKVGPTSSNYTFTVAPTTGNVLIGTTTDAGYRLDVNGAVNTNSYFQSLGTIFGRDSRSNNFITYSDSSVASNRTLTIGNATYSSVLFPNGNVGIGTTSPNRPLTIETSTADVLGALKIKNTGTGDASMFFQVGSSTVWQLGIDNSDGDKFKIGQDNSNADVGVGTKLTIDTSGNVGIGTTGPSALLHVNKGIVGEVARLGAGNYQLTFGVTTTYGEIQAVEQGVAYRNLLLNRSGGNVLIGTTTDNGYKLDVNGTATFRDDVDMRTNYIDFKSNGSSTVPQFFGHRSSTDLDSRDWTSEGGWAYTTFDANSLNAPNSGSGLHNANGLLSFNTHNGDYGHQIAMTTNTNKLHFRTRNAGAWQSWHEITTNSKDFIPATDSTYDIGSSSVRFANGYFDTLYGDGSNLTNIPEIDTLATVTTRGNTTTNDITIGGLTLGDSHFIGNQTTYDNLLLLSSANENIVLSSAVDLYFNTGGTSAGAVGSTRMFISGTNGNVGIGTTSPSEKLDVAGNIQVNGNYIKFNEGTNAESHINSSANYLELFANSPSAASGARMWLGKGGTVDTGYYVNGGQLFFRGLDSSTKMYINGTSGKVGIGTTSPDVALDIQMSTASQGLKIRRHNNSGQYLHLHEADGSAHWISAIGEKWMYIDNQGATYGTIIRTNGNDRVIFTSGGNVLIGTSTDAGYKLDVAGNLRAVGTSHTLDAGAYELNVVSSGLTATLGGSTGGDIGGKAATYHFGGVGSTLRVGPQYTSDRDYIEIVAGNTNSLLRTHNELLTVKNTGGHVILEPLNNVGIGTDSPSAKLVVKGADSTADFADYGIAAFENQQNEGLSIGYDTDGNYTYLYSRELGVSSRGLRLNGSVYVAGINGNVGIGTTSPSEILHVAGNMRMDGSILRMGTSTTKLVLQNVSGAWNSLSAKGINIGDWNSDPSYGDILVGNYDFSIKNDALTSLLKVKNNGNVLIGTTIDNGYLLQVTGDATINGHWVGIGPGSVSTNVVFGQYNLNNNVSGGSNTAIGYSALSYNTGSNNTAVGRQAGYNNTTGSIVALGYEAGFSNTTGGEITALGQQALRQSTGGANTAIGHQAAYNTTTSTSNTAIGRTALLNNTTGSNNTAVGRDALRSNTTVSNNTAVGQAAAYSNTTGSITALGYAAGFSSTTGLKLTAIGQEALRNATGNENTAVGYRAAYNTTTGIHNTALGQQSLLDNTTGSGNTSIGSAALENNTASNNTALGFTAGYSNTTGSIVAVGYEAGFSNTTGTYITAIGYQALYSNSTGIQITAVGYEALRQTTGNYNTALGFRSARDVTSGTFNVAVGRESLRLNQTGAQNVAIGSSALYNNTASSNTAIGYGAGVSNTTGSNNIFIGKDSDGVAATDSNRTFIGNSSTTSTWVGGNLLVGTTTDAGYKLNVNGEINSSYAVNNSVTFKKSFNIGNITAGSTYTLGQLDFGSTFTHHFRVRVSSYAGFKEFDFHGYQSGLNKSSRGYNSQITRYSDIDIIIEKVVDGSSNITGVKIAVQNGSINNDYVYTATIECLSLFGDWTDLSSSTVLTAATIGESVRTDVAGGVVYVDENNSKVGIGTNTPDKTLHIEDSTRMDIKFKMSGSTTSDHYIRKDGRYLRFRGQDDNTVILELRNNADGNQVLMPSGGNVIIGSSTDSGYKLQVNGTTKIQAATSAALTFEQSSNVYQAAINSSAHLVLQSAANNQIMFKDGGTTNMVIDGSTANVGIGTTSPAQKLHVVGNIYSTGFAYGDSHSAFTEFRIRNNENNVLRRNGSTLQLNSTDDLVFSNTASFVEAMRIKSSGNVGIGTTSPDTHLHINGTGAAASGSQYHLIVGDDNTYGINKGGGIIFRGDYNSSGAQANFGAIRAGKANANDGNANAYLSLLYGASGTLTEGLRLDYNGNVGIGTTSPAGPLHVKYSSSTLAGITIENDGVGFNAGSLTLRSGTSGGMNMSVTSGGGMYWYSLSNSSNALTLSSSNNLIINGATDNGKKLQVNGDVFIKGSTSASSTKIFEVQNSNGTSIMDFRGDAYAFFGCGQGGGAASGFIFRYNDTSHVQFTGYNYGNGSGSYKPILLDTDLVGRGQGIYVNFGGTGYANPAPLSTTEFAVRGRTSDSSQNVMQLRDSNNTDKFVVRNDGAIFTAGSQGWTGTVSCPSNPVGQQNLQFVNGILVNVF